MSKRLTTEEWVQKAELKHSKGQYTYSLADYTGADEKVEIVCNSCDNIFQQRAAGHLAGKGCPICKGGVKGNTTNFIRKSKKVHGDVYTYDRVEYKNDKSKVLIGCQSHGYWKQSPGNHLTGYGCPKCGVAKNIEAQTLTFLQFKQKVKDKYGTVVYDYTDSVFNGVKASVRVNCTYCHKKIIFGVAESAYAKRKITSCDCQAEWAYGGYKPYLPGTLYYLRVEKDGVVAYKIGITNKKVTERYTKEELKNVTVIKTWDFPNGLEARQEETRILRDFKVYLLKGVCLLHSGNTELFDRDVLQLDKEYNE